MRGSTRLGIIMHGADAGMIDLGNEPPLSIGDEQPVERAPARRAVSWRWLTGTILTGVTSIGLMGAALSAALNNPNQFASLPEAFAATASEAGALVFGRKADRMRPLDEQVSSRQILQVSTVTRQGERDFIKLKPFARISATLGLAGEEIAELVPAFDVLRIFADTSAPEEPVPTTDAVAATVDDQFYGANVDGEVAVRVSAFPIDTPDLEPAAELPTSEVEQMVRAVAYFPVDTELQTAALPFTDALGFEPPGEESPFSALGVRIVPENVSNIAKSEAAADGRAFHEKVIRVSEAGDLRSLFEDNDIVGTEADLIIGALAQLVEVDNLHPGQMIRLAFAAGDPAGNLVGLVRVSVYEHGAHQATVARNDDNTFVRADEPGALPTDLAEAEAPPAPTGGLPKIYDAVYQTALAQQVPQPLVDQLIRIFAFDVDFQSRITPGDAMEIFHSLPDADDRDGGEPEILFAALTLNGVTQRFYRFRTADDGVVDYYDEEGRSAKKFLIRKPVPEARITSQFGYRRHPIIGKRILHTGVDYAAPRGTPILAAGNGIVEKAGRTSGYGNFTLIRHTNGYETAYAHQTSFANGIVPGARVSQGQIIGYVGSTGLSTGPHLHFEVRINKKAVDPLRIRLPRGRVLENDLLAAFEHERQRIDALLGSEAPTKVAAAN